MSKFDFFRRKKKIAADPNPQCESQPSAPGSEHEASVLEAAAECGTEASVVQTVPPAAPAVEPAMELLDLFEPSIYEGTEPEVQERLLRLSIRYAGNPALQGSTTVWASSVRKLYAASLFSMPVPMEDLLGECEASDQPVPSLLDVRQRLTDLYEQMTWLPFISDTNDPEYVRREQHFVRNLEEYCRLLVECVDNEKDRPMKMKRCKAILEDLCSTPGHESDAVLSDLEADYFNRCVGDGIRDIRSMEFSEEQLNVLYEHLTDIVYRDTKRQDVINPDEKYGYNNYIYGRGYVRDSSWDVTVEVGNDVRARVIDGIPYLEFGWVRSHTFLVKQQEPVYDLALFPNLKNYVLAATQHSAAIYNCKDGKVFWRSEIPFCEKPIAFLANNGHYMVVGRKAWEIRYECHFEEK